MLMICSIGQPLVLWWPVRCIFKPMHDTWAFVFTIIEFAYNNSILQSIAETCTFSFLHGHHIHLLISYFFSYYTSLTKPTISTAVQSSLICIPRSNVKLQIRNANHKFICIVQWGLGIYYWWPYHNLHFLK